MAKQDDPSVLADLKAALQQKGGSLRSPLYQWMYRNHDELVELFDEAPPNWQQVTAVLTSRGFTGVDGKPLQPQSVRRLWLRVKERHAKAQTGKKPKPKPVGAAPVVTEAAPEPADPNDALARIRSKINKHSGRTE
jgi:hypothetical protein